MTKPHKDPITGDTLTTGEWVSWKIQGVLRRWAVLIGIILVTVVCWITTNSTVLLWWNLSASLLAIIIEFIVGIAVLGQTKRDALILRHTAQLSEINQRQLEHLEQLVGQIAAITEVLDTHVNTTAREHGAELASAKNIIIEVRALTEEDRRLTEEVHAMLREREAAA